MTTSERKRRMPRAERERQMMGVAEEIFAERGYAAVSMDEIAERCGVSKPMIYEYFGSKEGLLVACIRAARADLSKCTLEAVAGAGTVEEALRRGLVAFFDFTDTHRRSWSLMLRNEAALAGPVAIAEVEEARREQVELDITLFAAFVPDKPRIELEMLAQILVGACERLSLWYVNQSEVTAAQAADMLMSVLWKGVAGDIPVG
ncbi:DNA-binding transcriptional regulator, AcrR family [Actinokineospora alba]|uniref:DNA-binding transcriptional regulator, AcrR family n=1 Tax=Actinokineospora alba TaxID=504798 RepID=A0A1H0VK97_9PSEU|nr:TetR/AcrR family transcriptional regulator [Actinokineospora alba]TDP67673.1 TetR family transcriptional regulator [Actinokineospora alba]SDJ28710.1 DNA-binding transcriptional regulator, AcrR family [Actinokineospora alba]SDP78731.1 DNA-binding transcriptional regulator, AcrR family [Actinokineospora alba]